MSLRRRTNSGFYSQIAQYGTLAALGAFAIGAKPGGAPIRPAPAPVAAVTPRSGYTTIARGAHPLARPELEIGRLPAEKHIANLSLVFKLSPQQAADRDALVEAVSNPKSPQYRQFLTPEQYASRFGAKPEDIARTEAWLASQGLEVYPTRSRLGARVTFGGTVGQLEAAFHTEMHQYKVGKETHYAMATAPSVPASLADIVLGIHNTHDFYPKPTVQATARERALKSAMRPDSLCPTGNVGLGCQLDAGAGQPPTLMEGIAPPDWRSIYDVNPLYTTGIAGTKITGSGVTIAIVGTSEIAEADLDAYWTRYGITGRPAITTTLVPNTGPGGEQGGSGVEAVLDNEYAGSIAPAATLNYVVVGTDDQNVDDGSFYAIEQNIGAVLSESWGGCEAGIPQSDADLVQVYGSAASLLGITYVAASGDSAAASCIEEGLGGLYVNIPAAYPGITSVGGTGFSMPNGLSFTGTAGSLTDVAAGYPTGAGAEQVWMEGNDPNSGVGGGGGGISVLFARPSYQTQAAAPTCDIVGSLPVSGITPSAMRQVPDVAFTAAGGQSQFPLFIECTLDFTLGPLQGGEPSGDCTNTIGVSPEELQVVLAIGGTSASTPSFAGVVALAAQASGGRLGSINPLLYALPSSVFHDVTAGNNEVLCTPGTDPGCPTTGTAEYGYAATTGYDCASGLGSIDATKFVTAIAALTPTTTTLAPVTGPLTEGTNVPLTATVESTGTTNTKPLDGNVTFTFQTYLANGNPDLSWTLGAAPLDGGAPTGASVSPSPAFAIPPGMVNSGKGVDIVAEYGGDATHLPSVSSKLHVTFAPVSFCPSPSAATTTLGGKISFTAAGGVAPVKWFVVEDTTSTYDDAGTNGSAIDEKTGVFTGGTGQDGYTLIEAIDSDGAETFGEVTVGSGDAGAPPWAGDAGFVLACPPPPAPDAGVDSGAGDAGGSTDAGPVDEDAGHGSSSSGSSGCSCTTAGDASTGSGAGALGGLMLGAALVARRRRSRAA